MAKKFNLPHEVMRNKVTGILHNKFEHNGNIYLVPQTNVFMQFDGDTISKILTPIQSAKDLAEFEALND